MNRFVLTVALLLAVLMAVLFYVFGWARYILIPGLFPALAFLVQSAKWLGSRLRQSRTYRVLVPLYAGDQEYLDFMATAGRAFPSEKYSRKAARDVISAVECAKKNWFAKPPTTLPRHFNINTVDFYHYPEGYDEASNRSALEAAIRAAIKERRDLVGVIGHITTSVTYAMGRLYAKYGLPVVLPHATAKNLTSYLQNDCKVPGVLRLVPNNLGQAEAISRFLLNQGVRRAVVVKDMGNLEYSDDLVECLNECFVQQPLRNAREQPDNEKPHGQILAVVPVGGATGEPLLNAVLKDLETDALIIVGMAERSLEILAQAQALKLKAQFTVLTDGTADEYLLPQLSDFIRDCQVPSETGSGADLPHESGETELIGSQAIYTAFPLNRSDYRKFQSMLTQNSDGGVTKRDLDMTHALYVADSTQVFLSSIYEDVVEGPYTWMKPAKAIIAEKFASWKRSGELAGVKLTYAENRTYGFDQYGDSGSFEYHIYKTAKKGNELSWEHDENCQALRGHDPS